MNKLSLSCIVLALLLHCVAPRTLPSESETTTEPPADVETTTFAATTTVAKAAATTTKRPAATPRPPTATHNTSVAPFSTFSPLQSLIKNVGYAFRIVMKLLAPLFNPPKEKPEIEAAYDDFDDQPAEEDEDAQRKALDESFLRVVRQVADQGRQQASGFSGYYDFIVNEYSYKFWAVYMLFASGLLIYSAISAIYFAKFNTSAVDYELYDEARASGGGSLTKPGANPLGLVGSLVSVHTFQTIMDAISNTKFEND